MAKTEQEIREFIKTHGEYQALERKYNSPTYEDSEYYRQEGMKIGYGDALDELESFLDED